MPDRWLNQAAVNDSPDNAPLIGVAPARVIGNIDSTGQGRVQVELPWLPDVKPWARVLAPSAGAGRGVYFIPQVDDEVLVAFGHGDVSEPYVLGSLWSAKDMPPTTGQQDPVDRRMIRTPAGHQLDFDDKAKSVTLTTVSGHTVTLTPDSITVQTDGGTASITLTQQTGEVSIEAQQSITLKAPSITLSGTAVKVEGDATVEIQGGGACEIKGGSSASIDPCIANSRISHLLSEGGPCRLRRGSVIRGAIRASRRARGCRTCRSAGRPRGSATRRGASRRASRDVP